MIDYFPELEEADSVFVSPPTTGRGLRVAAYALNVRDLTPIAARAARGLHETLTVKREERDGQPVFSVQFRLRRPDWTVPRHAGLLWPRSSLADRLTLRAIFGAQFRRPGR